MGVGALQDCVSVLEKTEHEFVGTVTWSTKAHLI